MNRRKVLKQVATAVGTLAVTPSILSFLRSSEANLETWYSELVPMDSKYVIEILVDFILPLSDTDHVSNLNLAQFVDKMMMHTEDGLSQEKFVLGLEGFKGMLKQTFNKNDSEATEKEIKTIMKVLCNLSKEKEIYDHVDTPLSMLPTANKEMYLVYYFVTKLRYYCLFGYYTSQEFMEADQSFDSFTGDYQGCVS